MANQTSPSIAYARPAAPPSIADYGAIGNCRSLALVSRLGSIDWWCLPDFSGASVFAALLDEERGGCFAIKPARIRSTGQRYDDLTNVLRTRFECEGGVLELVDFMTLPEAGGAAPSGPVSQEIVRIARCIDGSVEVEVLFEPRPCYATRPPGLTRQGRGRWHCSAGDEQLELNASFELEAHPHEHSLTARLRMRRGTQHVALLRTPPAPSGEPASLTSDAEDRLAATLGWWRGWCGRCRHEGRYADPVMRSALALKLLTFRPTGAVVAAATTSLPESETGERNWDYRYCWLRDTSLVLNAFTELGYSAESDAFLRWLLHATRKTQPKLQVLYDVHGETILDERTLDHLRGYHGIGPVHVGNAASTQQQNDVYGEVLLTAWNHARRGGSLDEHEKSLLAGFAGVVCDIWRKPDHGIWEIRLAPRHNTHSKLMCWVALDRALALHQTHELPIDARRVEAEREAIRDSIETHGFHAGVDSYVGFYGGDAADSSLLLMPRFEYLRPDHPRMRGTVRHIMNELRVGDLLYRYPPGGGYDGICGPEHLFAICSFWCVDCLARQGRLHEAQEMYEQLLALRNPVGLYAEEFGVHDRRPMGNFPQAFSHVGSITAALALEDAREGRKPGT